MYELSFRTEVALFWFYFGEIVPPSSPLSFQHTALPSNIQYMFNLN